MFELFLVSCTGICSPHHIIWASLGLIGIIWLRIMGFTMAGWIIEGVQEGVWTYTGNIVKAAIRMGLHLKAL
ncbi:hypothetical protein RhiirA1_485708 [Rhizophagus irregularis]|uniref:Uncharacterized protein n=1 Tax=Rhizophagus irregularis TaxID=588596 RepID=A0A2N0QHW2_9GLOM|nr:hypothetical protein RhiirA1_485708 [Rhizophagus irregularis]